MKYKLMIQALSPLALLTIIKNFSFIVRDECGKNLDTASFISANLPLLIILAICVVWILFAAAAFLWFNSFRFSDRKGGYTIKIKCKKEEDSLNFFMTLILPLLIDDVNTWQGAILFIVIIALIWGLLARTNLFFANPVLSILGYRCYEVFFPESKKKAKKIILQLHAEISTIHIIQSIRKSPMKSCLWEGEKNDNSGNADPSKVHHR